MVTVTSTTARLPVDNDEVVERDFKNKFSGKTFESPEQLQNALNTYLQGQEINAQQNNDSFVTITLFNIPEIGSFKLSSTNANNVTKATKVTVNIAIGDGNFDNTYTCVLYAYQVAQVAQGGKRPKREYIIIRGTTFRRMVRFDRSGTKFIMLNGMQKYLMDMRGEYVYDKKRK